MHFHAQGPEIVFTKSKQILLRKHISQKDLALEWDQACEISVRERNFWESSQWLKGVVQDGWMPITAWPHQPPVQHSSDLFRSLFPSMGSFFKVADPQNVLDPHP